MNWVAMPTKVWQDIHDLPLDYVPPPWEELLLDAIAELPRVGPAVVLAATAQEVFISKILDNLARLSSVPPALWEWINDRGYVREPTVEEQYDSLLKFFTGHSLKEDDGKLWESLKNLRTARNAFVHRGTAQLGDVPVSTDVAAAFINSASATVLKIREWLPQELQWAVFSHTVHVEARKKLT